MGTKEVIKDKGRKLFNQFGVRNITLRDIAKEMGKSYGNITYHYPTKPKVLIDLYDDMNKDLSNLRVSSNSIDILEFILTVSRKSYDISIRYLLFSIDHTEIRRNHPSVYERIKTENERKKIEWLEILKEANDNGYFRKDLQTDDLYFIMFLSGAARTAYFQLTELDKMNQLEYSNTVNNIIKPYLSEKGLEVYNRYSVG